MYLYESLIEDVWMYESWIFYHPLVASSKQVLLTLLFFFTNFQHLGKAQGDDYTLDDMFVTASATKGATQNEDKRTKEQAIKGIDV